MNDVIKMEKKRDKSEDELSVGSGIYIRDY